MRWERLLAIVLGAGLELSSAWAAGTNSVPSLESFESYAVGIQIDGAEGWSAAGGAGAVSDDAAILDALEVYVFEGGTLPIDTTHDKVLKLAGPVTQSVDGPAGERVLTDFMLLPLRREEAPALAPSKHFGITLTRTAWPRFSTMIRL